MSLFPGKMSVLEDLATLKNKIWGPLRLHQKLMPLYAFRRTPCPNMQANAVLVLIRRTRATVGAWGPGGGGVGS